MDLHMEHINRIAKGCITSLQAGRNPKTIDRIGMAIGTIAPQFELENDISPPSGAHKQTNYAKDLAIVVKELLCNKVFTEDLTNKRKHKSFPNPKNLLHHRFVKTWVTPNS